MQISVIIPAWNEEDSIGGLLAELAAVPLEGLCEVMVVDGGSTDRTVEIAQAGGARVLHEPRRGYGRACHTGAVEARGELLAFLDADGADDPAGLAGLVAPLLADQADLVLGSRLAGRLLPGAMPWHQQAGNRLAAALFRLLYGLRLTDLSPMRAVTRAALLRLPMREMTYGWPTEMIARASRAGWRIVEIPVTYRPRMGGQSKISGTLRGTVLATYYILKVIARYAGKSG